MESATAMPKLTRENLLAHGFKQSEKDKDLFVSEHARLGDVESALGFQITALRPTVSQPPHSDTRQGLVEGKQVLVQSEVRDEQGRIVRKSLDKTDAICTVHVWVKKYVPPKPPLRSDSTPRVQVKSVTVPKDRAKPLQVTFELAADGKTPVGLLEGQFGVKITRPGSRLAIGPDQLAEGCIRPEFPKGSFEADGKILVKPGSPVVRTAKVPDELTISLGEWSGLEPGKYDVRIFIVGRGFMKGMGYDYMWHDGNIDESKVESKTFEFTVPKD